MAEMPNVISGNTITSAWGNQIRDRTIQRYADNAERTSLAPSPAIGDLAFMENTGLVYVYFNSAWRLVGGVEEVDGFSAISGATGSTSYGTIATAVNLPIPTHWGSWVCTAFAHWKAISTGATTTYSVRMQIDGTDGDITSALQALVNSGGVGQSAEIFHQRSGMTTTGSRTIALRAKHDAAISVSLLEGSLYARAVRLS